jgi:hypothetical protein
MTNLKVIRAFCQKAASDARLGPCHISLYVSLFQQWVANHFPSPMPVLKTDLMKLSKLNGNSTYYKVIRELHEFGYIQYFPGDGLREKSKVLLNRDTLKFVCLLGLKFKLAM